MERVHCKIPRRHAFRPRSFTVPAPRECSYFEVKTELECGELSKLDFNRLEYYILPHMRTTVWAGQVFMHHRLGDALLAKHVGASTHFDGVLDVI